MTRREQRAADPTICVDCGHDVALHRSTGCLFRLGACPCLHDMRPAAERKS